MPTIGTSATIGCDLAFGNRPLVPFAVVTPLLLILLLLRPARLSTAISAITLSRTGVSAVSPGLCPFSVQLALGKPGHGDCVFQLAPEGRVVGSTNTSRHAVNLAAGRTRHGTRDTVGVGDVASLIMPPRKVALD